MLDEVGLGAAVQEAYLINSPGASDSGSSEPDLLICDEITSAVAVLQGGML
jgi:hypothetical protein